MVGVSLVDYVHQNMDSFPQVLQASMFRCEHLSFQQTTMVMDYIITTFCSGFVMRVPYIGGRLTGHDPDWNHPTVFPQSDL